MKTTPTSGHTLRIIVLAFLMAARVYRTVRIL